MKKAQCPPGFEPMTSRVLLHPRVLYRCATVQLLSKVIHDTARPDLTRPDPRLEVTSGPQSEWLTDETNSRRNPSSSVPSMNPLPEKNLFPVERYR